MREDLDAALCRDFPLLYRDRNASEADTCMSFGFPGDGWEPLIRRLSEKLEPLIAALPPDDEEGPCCAAQVKEKFGTLRFYMMWATDEMDKYIRQAEGESARTCEECGAPGQRTSKGWIKTLCPEHSK